MILRIKYKEKKIYIRCKKVGFFGKFSGLMFKKKNYKNLFFEKANNIHSLFVFQNFLAVWLDKKNNVVKIDLVKPFRFFIKKPKGAEKLIEIQINEKNKKIVKDLF